MRMSDAALARLFAILEEIQNSTDKLRDVITEADKRPAGTAKQDERACDGWARESLIEE
jgi:hypothetical protein